MYSVRSFDETEGSFHNALKTKNLELLKKHINENKCDVNEKFKLKESSRIKHPLHNYSVTEKYDTPLNMAIKAEWKEGVAFLLDAGADVEQADFYEKYTTLTLDSEDLRDRSLSCSTNFRPLLHAASVGNGEIFSLLLEKHADVNGCDDQTQTSPVHIAAKHGHIDLVKKLVDLGAKLNVLSEVEGSPLCAAARFSSRKQENSNETGAEDISDSHITASDVAQILIVNGCDVNLAEEGKGSPALSAAAYEKNLPLVKLLLEKGANVNVLCTSPEGQSTPLIAAIHFPRTMSGEFLKESQSQIVNELLKAGADVNLKEADGQSPVVLSCKENSLDLLKLLFKAGVIMDSTTSKNALMEAVKNGHLDIVKSLIHYGVDIFYTDLFPYVRRLHWCIQEKIVMKRHTLLEYAVNLKQYKIAAHLVDCGCPISEKVEEAIEEIEIHKRHFYLRNAEKDGIDEFLNISRSMQSLKWLTRTFCRRECGLYTPSRVEQLPLPMQLQKYLLCSNVNLPNAPTS